MQSGFNEIFEVELECWCYGLQRVKEEIDSSVVHKVVKEFSPVVREAIQHLYRCDLSDTAHRLATAAKCRVSEKEIAFNILSQLPAPTELSPEQASVLADVVDIVERTYGGAVRRLEKKWKSAAATKASREADCEQQFSGLAFPAPDRRSATR